jgi:DNA-binding CsgD family transcriptional regulator
MEVSVALPAVAEGAMPPGGIELTLGDLRRLARGARRRSLRPGDAAPLLIRLLQGAHTLAIEARAGGTAFRFEAREAAGARCRFTCVIHDAAEFLPLTASEREVAEGLCDGRTLAQIARLRGVTINTVKSQVRQIFRKLDVDSRVALVRRLCP